MKPVNSSLTIPEVFDRIRSAGDTVDEKAKELSRYAHRPDIRWIVDYMYNADVTQVVIPEYKKNNYPLGCNYMSIGTSIAMLNTAIQHRSNPKVYERNLITILESVHATEAEFLEAVLKGGKVEGISKAVFKRVFPGFFTQDGLTG